jgi:hypothetical protein
MKRLRLVLLLMLWAFAGCAPIGPAPHLTAPIAPHDDSESPHGGGDGGGGGASM